MTSHSVTVRALSLLGQPRVDQQIHVVASTYGGFDPIFGGMKEPRHVVDVDGQLYRVSSSGLRHLEDGKTPEWLGLDPIELEDEE